MPVLPLAAGRAAPSRLLCKGPDCPLRSRRPKYSNMTIRPGEPGGAQEPTASAPSTSTRKDQERKDLGAKKLFPDLVRISESFLMFKSSLGEIISS